VPHCEGYCPSFARIETPADFKNGECFLPFHLCPLTCRDWPRLLLPAFYGAARIRDHIPKFCPMRASNVRAIELPQCSRSRVQKHRRLFSVFSGRIGDCAVPSFPMLFIIPSKIVSVQLGAKRVLMKWSPIALWLPSQLILFFYGIAVWVRGGARFWLVRELAPLRQPADSRRSLRPLERRSVCVISHESPWHAFNFRTSGRPSCPARLPLADILGTFIAIVI